MIETKKTAPEVLDSLEQAIYRAVEQRIATDPDVDDTYLHVVWDDDVFCVKVMYIEDSLVEDPNVGVALLDLMDDVSPSGEGETWRPNAAAIRQLAESYSQMFDVTVGLN